MNRTFKTLWNDVRRSFVAVNETQNSHGKPSKTVVALTAAAVISEQRLLPLFMWNRAAWAAPRPGNRLNTAATATSVRRRTSTGLCT
ncbi:ESPR-type extended signal peptide-containing protein [Duodenibacillus massiliensis]|uniref:ESPR-type extended signal peptide-containing protein n=1 Tax=Duodenibacillus massiliensis TaxID=1852381 RepID=UPI003C6D7BC0